MVTQRLTIREEPSTDGRCEWCGEPSPVTRCYRPACHPGGGASIIPLAHQNREA